MLDDQLQLNLANYILFPKRYNDRNNPSQLYAMQLQALVGTTDTAINVKPKIGLGWKTTSLLAVFQFPMHINDCDQEENKINFVQVIVLMAMCSYTWCQCLICNIWWSLLAFPAQRMVSPRLEMTFLWEHMASQWTVWLVWHWQLGIIKHFYSRVVDLTINRQNTWAASQPPLYGRLGPKYHKQFNSSNHQFLRLHFIHIWACTGSIEDEIEP